MNKHFALVLVLFLSLLTGCANTKLQKENEQLNAQVADLQKQLGEMGNRVDQANTANNDLAKANAALKQENNRLRGRRGGTRTVKSRKRRRRTSRNE